MYSDIEQMLDDINKYERTPKFKRKIYEDTMRALGCTIPNGTMYIRTMGRTGSWGNWSASPFVLGG